MSVGSCVSRYMVRLSVHIARSLGLCEPVRPSIVDFGLVERRESALSSLNHKSCALLMAPKGHKRKFVFELTAEERDSSTKKVNYAERIPACQKTNDELKNEDIRNARAALVTVVDGLWRHPELAVPCATWFSNRLTAMHKPRGNNYFLAPPLNVRALEENYVADFIVKHSRITMATLEAMSVYDPDTPWQLLSFAIRGNMHMKLDARMVDKELCSLVLVHLMGEAGDRLEELTDEVVKCTSGGVNWYLVGPYELDFADTGLVSKVTHRPTGDSVDVPEHDPIHKSMKLAKPWSDFECYIDKKTSQLTLARLFSSAQGPHKSPVVTASSEPMQRALTECGKRLADLRDGSSSSKLSRRKSFKEDHKQLAQQAGIERARRALKDKKAELEKKRTMALDSIVKNKQ